MSQLSILRQQVKEAWCALQKGYQPRQKYSSNHVQEQNMHAANETLSIHPREFIFFSYWRGGERGCKDGIFFLKSWHHVPRLGTCVCRMFPSSQCVPQGCSQKHPKCGGKRKRDKACFYFGEGSILSFYVRECPMFQKYQWQVKQIAPSGPKKKLWVQPFTN